ncbi:hypothetical protein LCGC14_2020260, partial [marine sediment metagenome]
TKPEKTSGDEKPPVKALGLSELKATIAEVVQTAVKEQVEAAITPLQTQHTDWMNLIKTNSKTAHSETPTHKKGIGAARFVRAFAFGRGDLDRARYFVSKVYSDELGDKVNRALQAGDLTAGGAFIPPEFAAEIIELLTARAVIRAAGARVLPMNSGTLTLRKRTAGSTATYVGEGQNITKTQPAAGQIVLTSKKLAAIVPISNDLLTFDTGGLADEFVRDDLVTEIAVREDQAFIRDNGLQDTPKGLRYWAQSANITSTNGTSSANIESDFKDLIQDLEGNDVRMIRPVWLMAPRSKNHLINLRDATGNLVYPEIRGANPTLYGWPVFYTTNIPTNLGSGSNETEVYLVDMADAIIGQATALELAVDSSASYIDSGSLVSAFSRDETLVRAISRHDFAVRHAESVALKSDVTWGA